MLLLAGFGGSLATKCVSQNNQLCSARPTFIDLNPDKLHYYLFMVSLDRFHRSCNTAEDTFGRICVPSKTQVVNLKVFNMINRINQSKILINIFHVEVDVNLMVENAVQN